MNILKTANENEVEMRSYSQRHVNATKEIISELKQEIYRLNQGMIAIRNKLEHESTKLE